MRGDHVLVELLEPGDRTAHEHGLEGRTKCDRMLGVNRSAIDQRSLGGGSVAGESLEQGSLTQPPLADQLALYAQVGPCRSEHGRPNRDEGGTPRRHARHGDPGGEIQLSHRIGQLPYLPYRKLDVVNHHP